MILDSGSSCTMFNKSKYLNQSDKIPFPLFFTGPDGSIAHVDGYGEYEFKIGKTTVQLPRMYSNNPKFENIISVPQLNSFGFIVIFDKGVTYIIEPQFAPDYRAYLCKQDNINAITKKTPPYQINSVDTTLVHDYYTNHRGDPTHEELGHLTARKMKSLGIPVTTEMAQLIKDCITCKAVKHKSLSYKHEAHHISNQPLEHYILIQPALTR